MYSKINNKTHRFMHPAFAELQAHRLICLPIEVGQHIRVLRLKIGDQLTLLDGIGGFSNARLVHLSSKESSAQVLDHEQKNQSRYHDVLIQALSSADKMDWVIEKATELGVSSIYPVMTARSQTRLDLDVDAQRALKKQLHWQAIARSACEQSGNVWMPTIAPPQSLTTVLQHLHTSTLITQSFVMDTQDHPRFMLDASQKTSVSSSVHIAIGPEGGFDQDEIKQFLTLGWQARSLGELTLRTETAPVVALSQLALWRTWQNKLQNQGI